MEKSIDRLSHAERFEAAAMPHRRYRSDRHAPHQRPRPRRGRGPGSLQAWRSFHRFEPGTNCRAWLFKILFNCVHHHRRRWFRFPLLKDTEEFLEANLAYTAPIPEHLTDDEILAALDRIPAEFRAVVLLVDVEEFAYKEPANILSIPI
jgi:RNA polymerase sigma-70 factor (ECF subfamily)